MATGIQQLQFNTLISITQYVGLNINGVPNPPITFGQQTDYSLNTLPVSFQLGWPGIITLSAGSSSSSLSSSSSSGSLASGYSAIDLTSLPYGTQPNLDMTGLTLRALALQANAANKGNIAAAPTLVNGYSGWAVGLIVPPGSQNIVGPLMQNLLPVSSSNRFISFSGIAGDQINVVAMFG